MSLGLLIIKMESLRLTSLQRWVNAELFLWRQVSTLFKLKLKGLWCLHTVRVLFAMKTFYPPLFAWVGYTWKKKIIQTAFNIKELWRPFSEKIYTSPKVYTKILTDKGAENHLRSSVEADCVPKAPSCFLLCCLEQLGQTALHIISLLETLAELTDDRSTKAGCLQRVLYFHVDHMHRLPGLLFSITQICHYYFIHSLSTGEDDIKGICALLKSFWTRLNYLISPQHVKHPTAAMAYLVFEEKILVYLFICGGEIIDHGEGASPGSVTQDPTPKDLTLNPFFLRMLWAWGCSCSCCSYRPWPCWMGRRAWWWPLETPAAWMGFRV